MTTPALLTGLHDIAYRYDALLCDVWGVVHDGRVPFADGCAALSRFKAERGPVVLISNSPPPRSGTWCSSSMRWASRGRPGPAWSPPATPPARSCARGRPGPPGRSAPCATRRSTRGRGIRFAEIPEEAAFVSCTGLFDDEIETPDDFRERLRTCVDRGLVMVCANPDRIVQRGGKTVFCAGALADMYIDLGGEVVMAGKPYAPIYRRSYAEAARLLGREPDRARLLAIGDGLRTDVEGANGQGLDVLFTAASGVHGPEVLGAHGALSLARTQALLDSVGAQAAYVMAELAW